MTALVSFCLIVGSAFVLVAAIGLVRLPDLLMRMHAATKAGTLGAGLLLTAVAVAVPGEGVAVKAIATIVFLVMTAPIASHVIARAAYYAGDVVLWENTFVDELAVFIRSDDSCRSGETEAEWGSPAPEEDVSVRPPSRRRGAPSF
ncbi:Na+/H+ antiporter subunit G [Longibacter salinarum]|uniref:Na+/H+ antiporter subunit G n=1 Tax=Longibacter salinarum TaxID=1850348 RepID=A0A2A8D2G2_9BACT|nr:monovalent cation/H(+) antiporter subunit G [Longibacter salinarum]PEN14838.1 Na+/H+ antiporter subunit G [Longibacter salinarum]